MGRKINNLLIKNGFRVFHNTKILASQLTILTTLASTSLLTTVMTNYNLNESKRAVIDNGHLFDFSIDANLNNDLPISIKEIKDETTLNKIQPKYQNHLSNIIDNHNYLGGKTITYNGLSTQTKPGFTIWSNEIPNNEQKLIYYYATTPSSNGNNLLKFGDINDKNFLSLSYIPNNLENYLLNNTSEIFSFSLGNSENSRGIPSVVDKKIVSNENLDIRNILVDENNNAVGYSNFGYIQVDGFDISNNISISHNVIDSTNINQSQIEPFKNLKAPGYVPNETRIYFGDQQKYIGEYWKNAFPYQYDSITTNETRINNASIFCSVGDSFNQLAANNTITQTKWHPYLISLNPTSIRGINLFFYKLFFDNPQLTIKENNYFEKLYQKLPSTLNLPQKRLNLDETNDVSKLISLQQQFPFLKYFKTIFWVPEYENLNENDSKAIEASFNDALNSWFKQGEKYLESIVNDKNADYFVWKNDFQIINENIKKIIMESENGNQFFDNISKYFCQIKNDFLSINIELIQQKINEEKTFIINLYKEDKNQIYINFLKKFLSVFKESLIYNINYIYNAWFTIEGLLNNFGFIYNDSKNFTTGPDINGISYTISNINNNVAVNNVVSNTPINWNFLKPSIPFNIEEIYEIARQLAIFQSKFIYQNIFDSELNYQWFVDYKPYKLYKVIADFALINGTNAQNQEVINECINFAKIDDSVIKTENEFNNIWKPKFIKTLDVFIIRSAVNNGNSMTLNLGYSHNFGHYGLIPLIANIVDKSSKNVILSETYYFNNLYSNSNPNGKLIYNDYFSFEKAQKLPFYSNEEDEERFDINSPHWIYNQDTNEYVFYKDYTTWFNSIEEKYKININGEKFLIVGSALNPEFLYPAQNSSSLLVNPKTSPIVFCNEIGFEYLLSQNKNVKINDNYMVRFPKFKNNEFLTHLGIFNSFKKFNNILLTNISNNKNNIAYENDDAKQPNYLLYIRTNFTNNVQHLLLVLTTILTIILLLLSGIFISVLIRSIVKQNKKTFAVAISNGIKRNNLIISMIPFALIPSIVSGVFGYLFATLLQPIVLNSINAYWNLPVNYDYYVWWIFILAPLVFFGILLLICYLVTMWTLRKDVSELMNSSISFKMNKLVESSKWFTKKMKATTAFKFTYMFGNIMRFITLTTVITMFISLSTISVGSINTFTNSLAYTERNKNYLYGIDLISPSRQGGWYDIKTFDKIGTNKLNYQSNELQRNLPSSIIGEMGAEKLVAYNNLINSSLILKSYLENNLKNYEFGTKAVVTLENKILKDVIQNTNVASLKCELETFENTDVFTLKPISAITNNHEIAITNPSLTIVSYISEPQIYNANKYESAWKDYYSTDLAYNSIYYPSFKISSEFLGNPTFFKNKTLLQACIDINFDIGAFNINPWIIAKTFLPSFIIQKSNFLQTETLKRIIGFFSYLDKVELSKIKNPLEGLNYHNFYKQMNIEIQNKIYNPININGELFKFDSNNNAILSPAKSLIVNLDNEYVLNQNISSEGLPTLQMKPQTIFLINIMNSITNNSVYTKWLNEIYIPKSQNKSKETMFKLAQNIVALSNDKDVIESTYSYATGKIFKNNKRINEYYNGKIIGLNAFDLKNQPIEKQSVKLYSNNHQQFLNNLLIEKCSDGTYPLIINEVVAKKNNYHINEKIFITPDNYLDRYIDRANNVFNSNTYEFTIVGITTSKSEQQMYSNQKFINEILGYNDSNVIGTYPDKNFVPFNGIFTNDKNSPMINNFASFYSVSGLSPINSLIYRPKNNQLVYNDAISTLEISFNKLNDILMFDVPNNNVQMVEKIFNVFSPNTTTLNFIQPSISNIDATVASSIIGDTIDSTIANIEVILILALLPTLLMITFLMATMIVTESRRLIAIMKVLGITDWKNTFNFLFIYFVVLLFSLLLAIPITYLVLAIFKTISFNFFNIIVNPIAPWWIYFSSTFGIGLIFIFMLIFVKIKMSKIDLAKVISFGD